MILGTLLGGVASFAGCAGGPSRATDAEVASSLRVVATMKQTPGNIAIGPDGRIFVSVHPFAGASNSVVEVNKSGESIAYPPGAWASKPGPNGVGIASVIGIECDADGILWMLDMGSSEPGIALPPRLIAWNTRQETLHRVIPILPPASVANGFPQDFVIDTEHKKIYIADMGLTGLGGTTLPAFIVVDLATGSARRVLEGAPELRSEDDARMVIDGVPVRVLDAQRRAFEPSLGLNPVAIDAECRWVYFGAMHGRTLYRVPAANLADASLDADKLARSIERYGVKPVSDGIVVDSGGNVYSGDVNANAIGVTSRDGTYRILVRDDAKLRWVDGFSFGPSGELFATVNQLHKHAQLNAGVKAIEGDMTIVRLRSIVPGSIGR
ncbi:MAG: L-dopachrome tautomerase-related protein [Planctomycetota bacterium]|nr:L-dopachrome tautomerase-related protein [Planctomycetota bacterium]